MYLTRFSNKSIEIKTESLIAEASSEIKERWFTLENIDGLLGADIFAGYWCELSFSKNKIILHKNKPKHFNKLLPCRLESDHFFTTQIEVNEKLFNCIVDTGIPYDIIFQDSVRTALKKEDYLKVLSNTQKIYYMVKPEEVKLFDNVINNGWFSTNLTISLKLFTSINGMRGGRGLIGINYLKNYDLLFDFTNLPYSTSGIYYSDIHSNQETSLITIPETGILFYYIDSLGIHVQSIIEDSPFHKIGIECGARIIKINDKNTASMSSEEFDGIKLSEIETVAFIKNGVLNEVNI